MIKDNNSNASNYNDDDDDGDDNGKDCVTCTARIRIYYLAKFSLLSACFA